MRFIETPVFTVALHRHLDDQRYRALQVSLGLRPEQGALIQGGAGARKLRWQAIGRGKRGGLRVIYYWWDSGLQFWLFTVYDKDEMADLMPQQRKALKAMIKSELEARRKT